MFDAAHAFGCTYSGKPIGNFGRCEVFSFHATKFFNSFEGGAVLTTDGVLAEKMRLMRNFGFRGYDNVVYLGTNGKMTEVCGAMGLTSLESIEDFVRINERNYFSYRAELQGIPGVNLIRYSENEKKNYHYIVCEIDEAKTGLTADQLVQVLCAERVLARRYFSPGCHRMEPYRSFFPNAGLVLPKTEQLCRRVLVLPNGTSMNSVAISQASSVRGALSNRTDLQNTQAVAGKATRVA
jgi:dTDP-4-amino-4,6-dideoxygalactose transaminase